MVVERHLEQRVQAETALGLQRLNQLFEGQVLMGLGFERTPLDLCQQLADGGVPIDFGLEHLGVDEKADQALGLDPVAVGNRHADANIRLAAVAMQQHLIGRQQQHEQRHTLALGQGLETVEQRYWQRDVQACTAMGRHCRALMIEWQFQHRLLATQHFTPVIELASFLACFHPAALPQCVIDVLDRQRRQLQPFAPAVGGIKLHQFIDHHLHRPTIGNNVVLHQHQHVFVLRQAQQSDTHKRALAEVEWLGDARFYLGFQTRFIDVRQGDLDPCWRADHLHGAAGILLQVGTQAFVARDQCIEGTLQGVAVELPFQAQRAGYMVGRAAGVQLPQEPLALLRIGQPQRLLTFDALHTGAFNVCLGQATDKKAQYRLIEQGFQAHIEAQAMTDARDGLGSDQRMPAALEEVVIEADTFDTEYFGPDRSDLLLPFSQWRDVLTTRCLGFGQGLAVQFAVGTQGHLFQQHPLGRDHVVRQVLSQVCTQHIAPVIAGVVQHQVAHQAVAIDGQHGGLADPVVLQQARFDFTQLDTQAAQLDLVVLRRAGPPGQPPGPCADRPWCRPGSARGHRHAAQCRNHGGVPRGNESRWRLRAAGHRIPARSPAVHDAGQPRAVVADPHQRVAATADSRRIGFPGD
ncbi:hypothetical protein A7318_10520 [Pseudomonas lurida]|nr:hypothetical protein A7318_10520 [Pseudomonas lurida]